MPGIYQPQVVQTDRTTATLLHLRLPTDPIIFWPSVNARVAMPMGNEVYRKSTFSYSVPKKGTIAGADSVLGYGVFDLTAKFNKQLLQTDIDASYEEFKKLLANADVKKAVCEQIRLQSTITIA